MTTASSASPSSEPTTHIRKRRRRNAQACHPCRSRKRKCDTSRPSCEMCLSSDMVCTWPEVDKRRTKSRLAIGAAGVDEGRAGGAKEVREQEGEERDDEDQDEGFDGDAQSPRHEQDQPHEISRGHHDRSNQKVWDQEMPGTDTSLTSTGHTLTMPGFDMLQSISDSPRRVSSFTSNVRTSPLMNFQRDLSTLNNSTNRVHDNAMYLYAMERQDRSTMYDEMFGKSTFPVQTDQAGSGGVYSAAHE